MYNCTKAVALSLLLSMSLNGMNNKRGVLILGAPRSGTSATTGVLNIMGLDLGPKLSSPQSWNPKGDFEDESTIMLNKQLIRDLGISPYQSDQPSIDWYNDDKALKAKDAIKNNIIKQFGHLDMFGLKHPRVCLLLPLYLQALEELDYQPYLINVFRDPRHTIDSLNRTEKQKNRFLFSEKEGMVFVSNFTKPINEYGINYPKMDIQFSLLTNDTKNVVKQFNRFLPELKKYREVQYQIDTFLGKA